MLGIEVIAIRDDAGRVRVKKEVQFVSVTQKLLERGEPALVYFGTSVIIDGKALSSLFTFSPWY